MNGVHIHLVVNHFQIITPILALLILIAGFIFKSQIVKRVAFALFIFGALFTFAAMATGEGAEDMAEELEIASHLTIHAHEEHAEIFAILTYVLGAFSLVSLWSNVKGKDFAKVLAYVTLAFSLIVIYFAQQTGSSGGEIRHTELYEPATSTPSK
jgi:uncharacterized membrane protein